MADNKRCNYISASQISIFLFCPLSYKYQYFADGEKFAGNIYTLYGDAIHQALAMNFQQKIETKKDLPYKEVHSKFVEVFNKGLDKGIDTMKANPNTLRFTAENVLYAYMKDMAPKLKPLMVEQKFEIKLKQYDATIFGFIDLITEDGLVIDHKTAGVSTIKDWTQTKADNDHQFTIYSVAYRKMLGKKEKAIRVDVIPRMDKPKFKSIYSSRTDEQIHKVLYLAEQMNKMAEEDLFYPNISNCFSCAYKDSCSVSRT